MSKGQVTFMREIVRDLHEHEILMSFNDDDDAVAFDEWWGYAGQSAFRRWLETRDE